MKTKICLFILMLGWVSSGRAQRPVFCSSPPAYQSEASGREVIVLEEADYLPELAVRQTRMMRQQLARGLASAVHYPAALRQGGVEGRVVVAIILNWQGEVEAWEILERSSKSFARAVQQAMRRGIAPDWPSNLYRGAARIEVPVRFRLP